MIPKSGTKFEEKLIFCFTNDKNLVNFDPSTKKSKTFAPSLVPLCKVYNIWPKKITDYISWHGKVI